VTCYTTVHFPQNVKSKGNVSFYQPWYHSCTAIAVMNAQLQSASDEPDGKFSNSFLIGFNAYQFIFEFGVITAVGASHIHSRIVTSPTHVEEFINVLAESFGEYMNKYGPSKEPNKPASLLLLK
jgi:uncharacterized protein DUF3467